MSSLEVKALAEVAAEIATELHDLLGNRPRGTLDVGDVHPMIYHVLDEVVDGSEVPSVGLSVLRRVVSGLGLSMYLAPRVIKGSLGSVERNTDEF